MIKSRLCPNKAGAQNLSSVNMNGTQSSQLAAPRPYESPGDKLAGPQQNGKPTF